MALPLPRPEWQWTSGDLPHPTRYPLLTMTRQQDGRPTTDRRHRFLIYISKTAMPPGTPAVAPVVTQFGLPVSEQPLRTLACISRQNPILMNESQWLFQLYVLIVRTIFLLDLAVTWSLPWVTTPIEHTSWAPHQARDRELLLTTVAPDNDCFVRRLVCLVGVATLWRFQVTTRSSRNIFPFKVFMSHSARQPNETSRVLSIPRRCFVESRD